MSEVLKCQACGDMTDQPRVIEGINSGFLFDLCPDCLDKLKTHLGGFDRGQRFEDYYKEYPEGYVKP